MSAIDIVGGAVLLVWIGLLAAYFAWAIKRYNINYGLSDHEWKVLFPSLNAKPKELQKYQKLHEEWVAERHAAEGAVPELTLTAPSRNPYWKNTFGLPPGVIRGALALTATVMFVVIEGVNLFKSHLTTGEGAAQKLGIEGQFDQLITAFMMVLAFYFGSRAVDLLQHEKAAKPAPAPQEVAKPELVGRETESVEQEPEPAEHEPQQEDTPAPATPTAGEHAPAQPALVPAAG